jgi:hypothetical protein
MFVSSARIFGLYSTRLVKPGTADRQKRGEMMSYTKKKPGAAWTPERRAKMQERIAKTNRKNEVISLDAFGWRFDVLTKHGCDWPDCLSRAKVHGRNNPRQQVGGPIPRPEHLWFCEAHGRDVINFGMLARGLRELSPPARAVYDRTRQALIAMGISTDR